MFASSLQRDLVGASFCVINVPRNQAAIRGCRVTKMALTFTAASAAVIVTRQVYECVLQALTGIREQVVRAKVSGLRRSDEAREGPDPTSGTYNLQLVQICSSRCLQANDFSSYCVLRSPFRNQLPLKLNLTSLEL